MEGRQRSKEQKGDSTVDSTHERAGSKRESSAHPDQQTYNNVRRLVNLFSSKTIQLCLLFLQLFAVGLQVDVLHSTTRRVKNDDDDDEPAVRPK